MKYLALLLMLGVSTYVLGGLIADMRAELHTTQIVLEKTRAQLDRLEEAHAIQREHVRRIIELLTR